MLSVNRLSGLMKNMSLVRFASSAPSAAAIKRPPSAYMLFAKAERAKPEYKDVKMTVATQQVGQKWRKLSNEEKNPFVSEAATLKADWQKLQSPDVAAQRNRLVREKKSGKLLVAAMVLARLAVKKRVQNFERLHSYLLSQMTMATRENSKLSEVNALRKATASFRKLQREEIVGVVAPRRGSEEEKKERRLLKRRLRQRAKQQREAEEENDDVYS